MPDEKNQSREGIRIHGIPHDGNVTGKEEQKASTYMAWNLFNYQKNGFTTVKPVLKLKNRFYGGKTGFSTVNLKTSRIQFQKW